MDCSTPGIPFLQHLPDFAQVLVQCISDTNPLLMPSSPSALSLSQHQDAYNQEKKKKKKQGCDLHEQLR